MQSNYIVSQFFFIFAPDEIYVPLFLIPVKVYTNSLNSPSSGPNRSQKTLAEAQPIHQQTKNYALNMLVIHITTIDSPLG